MIDVILQAYVDSLASPTPLLTENEAERMRLDILWEGTVFRLSQHKRKTLATSDGKDGDLLTATSSTKTKVFKTPLMPASTSRWTKLPVTHAPLAPLKCALKARNNTGGYSRRNLPRRREAPLQPSVSAGPTSSIRPSSYTVSSPNHTLRSSTQSLKCDTFAENYSRLEEENHELRWECLQVKFEKDNMMQKIASLGGKQHPVDTCSSYLRLLGAESRSQPQAGFSCESTEEQYTFSYPISPTESTFGSAASSSAPSEPLSLPAKQPTSSRRQASYFQLSRSPIALSIRESRSSASSASSSCSSEASTSSTGTPPPSPSITPSSDSSDSNSDTSDGADSEYDVLDLVSNPEDSEADSEEVREWTAESPPPSSVASPASRWSWEVIGLTSPTCSESSFFRL